jgi:hypothetical protein
MSDYLGQDLLARMRTELTARIEKSEARLVQLQQQQQQVAQQLLLQRGELSGIDQCLKVMYHASPSPEAATGETAGEKVDGDDTVGEWIGSRHHDIDEHYTRIVTPIDTSEY